MQGKICRCEVEGAGVDLLGYFIFPSIDRARCGFGGSMAGKIGSSSV